MSGGLWLVFWSIIYLIAESVALFGYTRHGDNDFTYLYIQIAWLFIMSMPLWIKPLARWCNLQVLWER